MPIKAGHLLLAGGGGVFLWSGIKGKSISSVFRQLAGGDAPSSAVNANGITGVPALTASTGSTPTSGGTAPAGAAGEMLSFMESKVGHPYSENLSLRLGPEYYDCSGLVWAAAQAAGINIPKALSNTTGEPPYLAAHGWSPITSESSVQEGDICFFVGADPTEVPGFGEIGHVGMCSSVGTLVSAYDTAQGVCYTPMAQDHFVVAFREKT
jgi:cell wall-associated NlpC family hydrolase